MQIAENGSREPELTDARQRRMAAYAIALLVGYSTSWWSFAALNSLGRSLKGCLFHAFVWPLERLTKKVHD